MARFSIHRQRVPSGDGVTLDLRELDHALEQIGSAGAELGGELMAAGAEMLVSEVLEVFEKQGAVAGQQHWADFWWRREGLPKPKGRRWQGSLKLLEDTGVLVGSITPFSEAMVAEAFTNVPYAGFHVSDRPRRKLPKRDFTAIDFDRAQKDFADLILSQLDANLQRP